MVCGDDERDVFSIVGDCMCAEGNTLPALTQVCLQQGNLCSSLVGSSFGECAPRYTSTLLWLGLVDSFYFNGAILVEKGSKSVEEIGRAHV